MKVQAVFFVVTLLAGGHMAQEPSFATTTETFSSVETGRAVESISAQATVPTSLTVTIPSVAVSTSTAFNVSVEFSSSVETQVAVPATDVSVSTSVAVEQSSTVVTQNSINQKEPGESRLLLHVASVHPRFPGENSEITVRIPLRPNVTLTRFDFGAEPGSPNYVYDDDPREDCECERRAAFSSLLESVQGMFQSLHDPSIVIQLGTPTMKETLKRFTAKDGTENTTSVEEVASWLEFRFPAHQLQGQPGDWACKISLDIGESWHETGKHVAFDGSRRLYTVTQYAASANPNRTMELLLTLERNLDNPAIAEFHFLQEDEHPLPPQIVNHPKTIVSRLSSRTTFSDLLRYALRELEGRRILITNMDILFDDSLDLIRTRLNDSWMSTSMVTLAVSDLTEDARQVVKDAVSNPENRPPGFLARPLISGSTVYAGWLGNRPLPITDERCNIAHLLGSFDAFVFSTTPPLNRQLWLALPELEFWQGVNGCENRFMYEVHRVTRTLWKNYCRSVRAVHMHVFHSPNAHPGDRVNLYGKSLHQFQAEELF